MSECTCRVRHVKFVITLLEMSLRHAVLGMLSVNSCTGYELTQWFDSSLQHAWHASHSQIYPELAKLQTEALAEVVE